jgi:hypothetical protein
MAQDAFDLIWLTVFIMGCLALPVVIGLISVLSERK